MRKPILVLVIVGVFFAGTLLIPQYAEADLQDDFNNLAAAFVGFVNAIGPVITALANGVGTNAANIIGLQAQANDHETRIVDLETGVFPIETLQVDGLLVEVKSGLPNPNESSASCPISHPFLIGGSHTFGSLDSSPGEHTITPLFDTDNNSYSVTGIIISGNGIQFQAHALCANFLAGTAICIGDIDFDFFPDGTPVPSGTKLTNQYAACGVALFTTTDPLGPVVLGIAEATSSTPNILNPQPKNTEDPIGVEFVSPVSEASINAIGVGFNGLILDAYNSGGVLVDSDSVVHPGTPTGSDILSVSGDDIVELVIHQITPGGKEGILIDGYFVDDLKFIQSVS